MRLPFDKPSDVPIAIAIAVIGLLLAKCTVEAGTEPINVNTVDGHVKITSSGVGATPKPMDFTDVKVVGLSGSGVGTVTSFSAGDLSPLFTTTETNVTTTPALSFVLSNAAAHSYFGNNTGSSGAPAYRVIAYSELSGTPAPITPAALTKVDDTNVTLTLGGTPATALLQAASITAGWTGTLSVARGGSGAGTLTGVVIGNGTSPFTTVTAPSGTIVGTTDTQTLTNKRINPRIGMETSSATSTPTADTVDQWNVTALAAADAFAAPTGTPVDGQKLIVRIKDNGTARALTWNAIYRASSDLALPSTTVISKTLYLGFIYNAADSKWDLLAVLNNF